MSSFPASQLSFLSKLVKHNDRVWFEAHKEEYRTTYAEFQAFALELVTQVSAFDSQVFAQPDYYKVFRIYRDVRFSKDKTPYKEHYSLEVVRGGRHTGRSTYYFRLKPNNLSLVGAAWFPRDNRELFAMRTYLSRHVQAFEKILLAPDFAADFRLDDPFGKLKTTPRGFRKDDPAIEYLRHKSFTVIADLPDQTLLAADPVEVVESAWRRTKPYLDFFDAAWAEITQYRGKYGL